MDLDARDRREQALRELSQPQRDRPSSADAGEHSVRARAPAPQERRVEEWPPEREDRHLEHEGEHGDEPGRRRLWRHPFAFVIGLLLFVVTAAVGYLYWDYAEHFETTDDAYIAARQFA